MSIDSELHILIIGAGTFGLSTALELLRRGHKNVSLLDSYPIPSPLSAGNDVNKVFQSVVNSNFYSSLALQSLQKWKGDPIYKTAYYNTGIIYGATTKESIKEIHENYESLKANGKDIEFLENPEDFIKLIAESEIESISLKGSERFKNWKGYYQTEDCGWTYASLALKNVATECSRLGAKFITDTAEELLFESNTGRCIGAKTFSGTEIFAKQTILCAGANSVKLLDFKNQLLAKCWTVGHIRLTEQEIEALKGSPVILNIDKGFCFEPDFNGDLKFCNEFPGYINIETRKGIEGEISIPVYKDSIPKEAELYMRAFLSDVFPKLSNRKFNVTKICWCTDTPDRHFLIDEHPNHKGLILGTGDSGQGFKYMPIVGEYIASIALDGINSIPKEKMNNWKWRPQTAVDRNIKDLQGRYGGSNTIKDLKDIVEWSKGTAI